MSDSLADKWIVPWRVSPQSQKSRAATPAAPESATQQPERGAAKSEASAAANPPKAEAEAAKPEPNAPSWCELGVQTVSEALADAASGKPPRRPLLRQPERTTALLDALRELNARGVPAEWRQGVAGFDPDQPIGDVPLARWRRFIEDARAFLRSPFASAAASLGWTAIDLFGCDPARPFARIDQMGLIWLIGEGELLAMSAMVAIMKTRTGARQTYRRRRSPDPARVPAWALTGGGGAPRAA